MSKKDFKQDANNIDERMVLMYGCPSVDDTTPFEPYKNTLWDLTYDAEKEELKKENKQLKKQNKLFERKLLKLIDKVIELMEKIK